MMTNETGKLVLVAGGAGFIGSHLCDVLLGQGARVICLDSFLTGRKANLKHLEREPRFDVIEHDVIESLPRRLTTGRFAIDRIYNLACPASPPHYQADPEHTMLTSVSGTHHLLRLAEAKRARFLLASTSEVYGDPESHPQRETYWGNVNPTGPRACYDEGKRAAEALTFDYERLGRAAVRVARIFNTYGPRMRADDGRVVSNVICQALAGDDITIYGDGSQTRSFCYVDDLVEGLVRLMESPDDGLGPVNLGNPNEMTIDELVTKVLALTGVKASVVNRPLPVDDPRRRRPDITVAGQRLGWAPRVSLEQGLKPTIAWFSQEIAPARETDRAARAGAGRVPSPAPANSTVS
jgi:UDP-glucuronate decarboxylase